ncbi:NAD(P)/FAD-dependent oxidoreductase [Kitasatospora sp. MBT66]|uniref:phytoene desaturase family protein n=1 Tax=Kitasatospora sp. MBT66 TaxID=1444769 RepID=UPI0005BB1FC1|nr:NAD(P)/FAD-dependent oxidoreductase [Kitasatospora sp. MBT66]
MSDAIVIGAGPNGLVAANILADAGWQVDVLEGRPEPGGAVRSDRAVHADYLHDVFSSFYPLAVASPAIGALGLGEHGLRWSHAPTVLAHPLPDGRCATLHRGTAATCTGLESAFGGADAEAWQRLSQLWDDLDPHLLRTLFTPFPPVRAGVAMAARLRAAGGLRALRFMTLPVRRLAQEEFTGPGAGLLLAGCALHADLLPEGVGSAAFGWLMAMLGQQVGWPVPVGGAAALTGALVRRLESVGGRVHCNAEVVEVVVRGGRALGVRTADGQAYRARRAVLADVAAPALYGSLVGWEHLPARMRADLRRFQWDFSTVKVDWALDGAVPWAAPAAAGAGTVHLGADLDELSDYALQLSTGRLPRHPFALLGQMTTADPSRSPAGTESAWAYTHVPQVIKDDLGPDGITGTWDTREAEAMADRIESQVERFAPGFKDRIVARRILTPPVLEAWNPNLVGGAINGGTTAPHQQLVFRPVPGTGRPETPVAGLYLASSSAHPGGGVHGACGANAARAALRSHRLLAGRVLAPGLAAAQRLLSGPAERHD